MYDEGRFNRARTGYAEIVDPVEVDVLVTGLGQLEVEEIDPSESEYRLIRAAYFAGCLDYTSPQDDKPMQVKVKSKFKEGAVITIRPHELEDAKLAVAAVLNNKVRFSHVLSDRRRRRTASNMFRILNKISDDYELRSYEETNTL